MSINSNITSQFSKPLSSTCKHAGLVLLFCSYNIFAQQSSESPSNAVSASNTSGASSNTNQDSETDESTQTYITIQFNDTVLLQQNQSAKLSFAPSYPVITFENLLNTEATILIVSGNNTQNLVLEAGKPVLWPSSWSFEGNAITITNNSIVASKVKVGYFSFAGKGTYNLTSDVTKVSIDQYQSLMGISKAQTALLSFSCSEVALLALRVGATPPQFLAINTSESQKPDTYQYVSSTITYTANNYYQLNENYLGKSVAIINVSSIPASCLVTYD